jgi:hypothetical protein
MTDRWEVERALRDSGLPATARHVALELLTRSKAGSAEVPPRFAPSLSMLAHDTGLDRSTIKRALNVLESEHWITRSRDLVRARADGQPTAYQLHVSRRTESLGVQPSRRTERPPVGAQSRIGRRTVRHRSEQLNHYPDQRFREFWKTYPRRTGKQAAARAWPVALADTEPGVIVEAVTRFARRVDGTDLKFICTPARWLAERRWCDDLVDAVKVDLPRKIT